MNELKKLRLLAGLFQKDAAKLFKVSRQSISNWEREARNCSQYKHVVKVYNKLIAKDS
jgi:DNA-binding XRE family transcriptional regulator